MGALGFSGKRDRFSGVAGKWKERGTKPTLEGEKQEDSKEKGKKTDVANSESEKRDSEKPSRESGKKEGKN